MSAQLQVVSGGGQPFEYPIGRDERLDGMSFTKWQYHRWLSSRTFRLMGWAEQGMARALFDMAMTETPVGTLPEDNAELAVMLRVDTRRVSELRSMDFGPLRHWSLCVCDGEKRLFHPIVLETVQDAIARRDARDLANTEKAKYQRIERLKQKLSAEGMGDHVLANTELVDEIDRWIGSRRRSADVIKAAILHAHQSGWLRPNR